MKSHKKKRLVITNQDYSQWKYPIQKELKKHEGSNTAWKECNYK